MADNKPLKGIKVVEWSAVIAGPTCARMMADWGADVIKVETPEGDFWRTYGPKMDLPASDDENPLFDIVNSNKRAVTLNLRTQGGKEILEKLISECDVFITNTRTRVLKKMGLDYDSIKVKYPHVIFATITGYGDTGPEMNRPGYDVVSLWAHAGFLADTMVPTPTSLPINSPGGMGDICTGSMLFGAVMAALLAKEKTGKGDKVSVSLYGAGVWMMGMMITAAQPKYGYKYPRERDLIKPIGATYMCKDGEYITVCAVQYERDFPKLCQALGVPEIAQMPEYKDYDTMALDENRVPLLRRFDEIFIQKTSKEWLEIIGALDLPCDILAHFKDISCDEQARANHFVEEVTFRNGEKAWLPRPCMVSDNLGLPDYKLAPIMGQDSDEIVAALGYTEEELDKLREEGAFYNSDLKAKKR